MTTDETRCAKCGLHRGNPTHCDDPFDHEKGHAFVPPTRGENVPQPTATSEKSGSADPAQASSPATRTAEGSPLRNRDDGPAQISPPRSDQSGLPKAADLFGIDKHDPQPTADAGEKSPFGKAKDFVVEVFGSRCPGDNCTMVPVCADFLANSVMNYAEQAIASSIAEGLERAAEALIDEGPYGDCNHGCFEWYIDRLRAEARKK